MCRRVEVLALFPGAPTLNVVHAHSDGVVIGVDHGAVCRMGKATVVLTPRAVSPLILPTHLETRRKEKNNKKDAEITYKLSVDKVQKYFCIQPFLLSIFVSLYRIYQTFAPHQTFAL